MIDLLSKVFSSENTNPEMYLTFYYNILLYVEDVIKDNYNLDIKNPNKKQDLEHLPPEKLIEDIMEKEKKVFKLLEGIKAEIKGNI